MILWGTVKCVPPSTTGAQWVTKTDAGEHKTPRSLRIRRHTASIKLPHSSAERRAASISTWNWSPEYQCNITLRLRIGLKGAPGQYFSLERRLPHKIGKCRRWLWQESCHCDVIGVISACVPEKMGGCSFEKTWIFKRQAACSDRHPWAVLRGSTDPRLHRFLSSSVLICLTQDLQKTKTFDFYRREMQKSTLYSFKRLQCG